MAVTVKLEVTPAAPWTAGQTVTLKATILQDTTPWPSQGVNFLVLGTLVYNRITDSSGVATVSYTIPWTIGATRLPCNTWPTLFTARHEESGMTKSVGGAVAYATRFMYFDAPATVATNVPFTVTGGLSYEESPGGWVPLAGKTVDLYYNATKIGSATTVFGAFSATVSIPSSGTYTLKAVYAGGGLTIASVTVEIKGKAFKFAPHPEASIACWLLTH